MSIYQICNLMTRIMIDCQSYSNVLLIRFTYCVHLADVPLANVYVWKFLRRYYILMVVRRYVSNISQNAHWNVFMLVVLVLQMMIWWYERMNAERCFILIFSNGAIGFHSHTPQTIKSLDVENQKNAKHDSVWLCENVNKFDAYWCHQYKHISHSGIQRDRHTGFDSWLLLRLKQNSVVSSVWESFIYTNCTYVSSFSRYWSISCTFRIISFQIRYRCWFSNKFME